MTIEILKIILNPAIIAIIALVFGYCLNKALERRKLQNTYWQILFTKRLDACQQLMRIIADQPKYYAEERITFINMCKWHNDLRRQVQALMPFIPPLIYSAYLDYLIKFPRLDKISILIDSDNTIEEKAQLVVELSRLTTTFLKAAAEGLLHLPAEFLQPEYNNISLQKKALHQAYKNIEERTQEFEDLAK